MLFVYGQNGTRYSTAVVAGEVRAVRHSHQPTKKSLDLFLAPQSHVWGQISQIMSSLPPKRDWGPKRWIVFPGGVLQLVFYSLCTTRTEAPLAIRCTERVCPSVCLSVCLSVSVVVVVVVVIVVVVALIGGMYGASCVVDVVPEGTYSHTQAAIFNFACAESEKRRDVLGESLEG